MQERQAWLPVLAAVLALAPVVLPDASARLQAATGVDAERTVASERRLEGVLARIVASRNEAWRWRRLMGKPLRPYSRSAERSSSLAYRTWVLGLWSRRAKAARRQAMRPPHLEAWRCIQRNEAVWDDPDAPYYGGLQMDLQFQRTYGADLLRTKGTADNWTPLEQMWVAERAYRSGRGFYPWPNTARYCGDL